MGLAETSCIIWNRREGDASDIGNNGVSNGTVLYEAGKYLNGSLVTGDNNGYTEFGNIGLSDSNKGCFDLWVIPKAASGSIGRIAEWVFYLNDSTKTFANRIGVYFDYTNSRIYVELRYGGSTSRQLVFNTSWTANQEIHIFVGWNDAIFLDTLYHLVLHVDGNFAVGDINSVAFSSPLTLSIFNALYFGGGPYNGQRCINTIGDNLKGYDGSSDLLTADIIANKDNEGFPVSGYPIANKYNFQDGMICH